MTRRRFEVLVVEDTHTAEVEVLLWEGIGDSMVGPKLLLSESFIGFQDPAPSEDLRNALRHLVTRL